MRGGEQRPGQGQSLRQEGQRSPAELSWDQPRVWGLDYYQAGQGSDGVDGAGKRPWTACPSIDIGGKSVAQARAERQIFQSQAL